MSEIILTPVMTSNTTPSGKCAASSQLTTSCEAFQAFRQTNSTNQSGYYNWIASGNVGNWISYEFDTPKQVTKLEVWNMNTSAPRAVKKFTFQGSNDGQTFTDIRSCSITSSTGGYKSTYSINSNPYKIYRLYITEVYDYSYTAFGRIDLIGETPHLKSAGSPEAIRDWFNASLYNKEEIDNLFIQNNQAGLIPYDLTVEGYEPDQYVKLVGKTSVKVYNLCLAALMGEDMAGFNINEFETPGKLFEELDICGWAVPFVVNGSTDTTHWTYIGGESWKYDQIDGTVIDTLIFGGVLGETNDTYYSVGLVGGYDKITGNFSLNFSTSYDNVWLLLVYTKP